MSTHYRPLSAEPRTILNPMRFWVATQNKYFKGKTPSGYRLLNNSNIK